MTEFRIDARFRGPDGAGNGGYVAGRAALLLGVQPAEVTLRRGMPLDEDLPMTCIDDTLSVRDAGGALLLEARPAPLELAVPTPPSVGEAEAAVAWFLGSDFTHSAGRCFVCGSNRPAGDGLRVFSGPVAGRAGVAAALWRPDAAFGDAAGRVRPEFLWSALDCAGHFAFTLERQPMRMLLGRITARIDGAVAVGEPCVVLGWQLGQEGRKHHAGTAIFGADGGLRALAKALWVVPQAAAAG